MIATQNIRTQNIIAKDLTLINALDSLIKSKTFKDYIQKTFIDSTPFNNKQWLWGAKIQATILNLSFWKFVLTNFSNIWKLRNAYKDLTNNTKLIGRVLELPSFKELRANLLNDLNSEQKANLQSVINAILQTNNQELIDGELISEVINLIDLEGNLTIIEAILDTCIKAEKRGKFQLSNAENLVIIRNLKNFKGIEGLINTKKKAISIALANFLTIFDQEKIENALSNLVQTNSIEKLLEISDALLSPDYIRLTSIVSAMLVDTKYKDILGLLKAEDLLLSLCFTKEVSDGEFIFSLSTIGQMLMSQKKDGQDLHSSISFSPLKGSIISLLGKEKYTELKTQNLKDQDFLKFKEKKDSGEIVYELSDVAKNLLHNANINDEITVHPFKLVGNDIKSFKSEVLNKFETKLVDIASQFLQIGINENILTAINRSVDIISLQNGLMLGDRISNLSDAKVVNEVFAQLYSKLNKSASLNVDSLLKELQAQKSSDKNIKISYSELKSTLLQHLSHKEDPKSIILELMGDSKEIQITELIQKIKNKYSLQGLDKICIDDTSNLNELKEESAINITANSLYKNKLKTVFTEADKINYIILALKDCKSLQDINDNLAKIVKTTVILEANKVYIDNIFQSVNSESSISIEKLCTRLQHEHQIFNLQEKLKNVKSEALFLLSQKVSEGQKNWSEVDIKNLIPDFSFIPKDIAQGLMNGNQTITNKALKYLISDVALRQKNLEDSASLQKMLSSIMSVFISPVKKSNIEALNFMLESLKGVDYSGFSVGLDILKTIFISQNNLELIKSLMEDEDERTVEDLIFKINSVPVAEEQKEALNLLFEACDKLDVNQKLRYEDLKTILVGQENLGLIKSLMEGKNEIIIQNLIVKIEGVTKEISEDEKLSNTQSEVLIRLLTNIQGNVDVCEAIKSYILKKCDQDSMFDVIIEVSKEIWSSEQYNDEDIEILTNKIIKPIVNQLISSTSIRNLIENFIDFVKLPGSNYKQIIQSHDEKENLKNLLKISKSKNSLEAAYNGANVQTFKTLNTMNKALLYKLLNRNVKNDPRIVGEFITKLTDEKNNISKDAKVDVKTLLEKSFIAFGIHTLSSKILSDVELSNAKFEGLVFDNTTFNSANLSGSEFYNCSFNNCIIDQNISLQDAKFDLKSLIGFIESAEKNKEVDIAKLLEGVKVTSYLVKLDIDAKLIYGLIQYSKISLDPIDLDDNLIETAFKHQIEYKDLECLAGEGANSIKKALGENLPKLPDIKELQKKLADIGISESVLKDFSLQIRTGNFTLKDEASQLEKFQLQCVKNILSGHYDKGGMNQILEAVGGPVQQAVLKNMIHFINRIIYSTNDNRITLANTILQNFDPVINVKTFNVVCSLANNDLHLNDEQQKDLISFLKVENDIINDKKLAAFIAILQSENYQTICGIVTALASDDEMKIKLYNELSTNHNLQDHKYDQILKGFSAKSDLNAFKEESMSAILKQWYLNRAAGKMKPEDARGGNAGAVDCLEKALKYYDEAENELASKITKATILKLFGERYLTTPDRLDDAEKIYNTTLGLVKDLDAEDKLVLENNSVLDTLVGDSNTGLCGLLYSKSKREIIGALRGALSGNVYLDSSFTSDTIKNLLANKLSKNGILIDSIITNAPSLEKHRDELGQLDDSVLKVIAENPQIFAERSAVIKIPGNFWGASEDRKLHDAMYKLDEGNLRKLLEATDNQFEAVAVYHTKFSKLLKDIIQNLSIIENIVHLNNALVERQDDRDCFNMLTNSEEYNEFMVTDTSINILANILCSINSENDSIINSKLVELKHHMNEHHMNDYITKCDKISKEVLDKLKIKDNASKKNLTEILATSMLINNINTKTSDINISTKTNNALWCNRVSEKNSHNHIIALLKKHCSTSISIKYDNRTKDLINDLSKFSVENTHSKDYNQNINREF